MPSSISISIIGASGKMGKALLELAQKKPEFLIVGGAVSPDSRQLGRDLGHLIGTAPLGISLDADLKAVTKRAAVIFDFSSPLSLDACLEACLELKKPLILGTTGHNEQQKEKIHSAAKHIPLLYSANFSFGVAFCLKVARELAPFCEDIQLTETHHQDKKDSPSGTALTFAQVTEKKMEIKSIRTDKTIFEHHLRFQLPGECIELKHNALSREAFAAGALLAAKFLLQKPAGLYSLLDLF